MWTSGGRLGLTRRSRRALEVPAGLLSVGREPAGRGARPPAPAAVGCLKCGSTMASRTRPSACLRGLEAAFEDNFFPREIRTSASYSARCVENNPPPGPGRPREPHSSCRGLRAVVVVGKGDRAPSNCQKTCETRSVVAVRRRPRPPIDNKTPAARLIARRARSPTHSADMVEHAFE